MLAHVVGVLREVVDEVVVVGSADLALPEVAAKVVVDREPQLGPLAGIREGLAAIRCERAYVTSSDAPLLTPDFARALLAFGAPCAPEVGGVVQPLAAVLPKAAAAEAERLIAAGRLSARGLLEAIGFRRVGSDELPGLDSLRSLDTPDAYLEAVRREHPSASALVEYCGVGARVPIGVLAQVLAVAVPSIGACSGGAVSDAFQVSLPGLARVRDARAPVGPDERVSVRKADG
jgi:molybdopterin-guanine dinucleotide biosynthesis protein A